MRVIALSFGVAAATTLDASKERPIMKVVRLLEDMSSELNKELEDDKAVHEMLDCWCKTNDKEKSDAIAAGEARQSDLESTMEEYVAKMSELKTQREGVMEELNQDIKAMQQADTLRMKEAKIFHTEETDKMGAIGAIKDALVVLGKHNSLTQMESHKMAKTLMAAHVADLALGSKIIGQEQFTMLKDFVGQAAGGLSFLAIPGMQSYAPASGQIFGVLSQMQEEFEASLKEAREDEEKAIADYKDLRAAKQAEIAAGQKAQAQIDADLAEFTEKHAVAAQELEDTKAQLELDRTFLAALKEKCAASADEFDARVKSRLAEISAVEDTIKILNSDETFELMGKSVSGDPNSAGFVANSAASFVQVSAESQEQQTIRRRVLAVLANNPALAMLSASVKLDAFTKVKEVIDKLIGELAKQQQLEVIQRDECKDDISKNERDSAAAYDMKDKLTSHKADLEKTIKQLTDDIKTSTDAVTEMQVQMKRASELREGENKDAQETITDQRLTQEILRKAMQRMMQVFQADKLKTQQLSGTTALEQQPGGPHIATSATHTDPGNGPASFSGNAAKNAGGKRVIALLEEVLKDSKATEDEAMRSEEDAQTAYENFMKDSNKSIKAHQESISNMSEANAKAKEDLGAANQDLKATMDELSGLHDLLGALHKSCDFVLNNFEARQAARTAEMDALREAKGILSGSK